jgi:hypothetical protein
MHISDQDGILTHASSSGTARINMSGFSRVIHSGDAEKFIIALGDVVAVGSRNN